MAAETHTGQGLLGELPTDWVKSELLETIFVLALAAESRFDAPTDWVKSELLETRRL